MSQAALMLRAAVVNAKRSAGLRTDAYPYVGAVLRNCQLSTVNCQLSIVNCELSTVNCQLSIVNCELSIVNCQL